MMAENSTKSSNARRPIGETPPPTPPLNGTPPLTYHVALATAAMPDAVEMRLKAMEDRIEATEMDNLKLRNRVVDLEELNACMHNRIDSMEIDKIKQNEKVEDLQQKVKTFKSIFQHNQLLERIPEFLGHAIDFHEWWDFFYAKVIANGELSPMSQYSILCSKLDPVSRALITHINPANPDMLHVKETLHEYFTREEVLLVNIIGQIKDLNAVRNVRDNGQWQPLRLLVKKVRSAISLSKCRPEYLGKQVELFIMEKFLMKLSPRERRRFYEHYQYTETFHCLLLYIKDRTTMNDICGKARDLPEVSENLCEFCRDDYHHAEHCDQVTTVPARLAKVQERNLCEKCLAKKSIEWPHNCESMIAGCHRCGKAHHVALCPLN